MTKVEYRMRVWPAIRHSSFVIHHFLAIKASPLAVRLLTSGIRIYQLTLSPALTVLFGATGGCRYTPTCSAYAVGALREHGAVAGAVLATKRICRCHPWGGCGHDPVPNKEIEIRNSKFGMQSSEVRSQMPAVRN